MKLERLQEMQMEEIMEWAGELDTVLTPDNLMPTKIKDYPAAREASARMKRLCKWKADEIKRDMLSIEDTHADNIEAESYIFKYDKVGQPVYKKRFNTSAKQARELRKRLAADETYPKLEADQKAWEIMYSDWVSHCDRLRQEMRLLEVNYAANGGEGVEI